jgi:hypothetical protein
MLLARTFPECVPGHQDGFDVHSLDYREPRRMFVRWVAGVEPRAAALDKRAELAAVLEQAGYVVTLPPGLVDTYVADRPHRDSGSRYEVVPTLDARWLVMDRWTRVHAAVVETEEEAQAEAARWDRGQALADARKAVVPELLPYLDGADELLGDGVWWLHREVHDIARYTEPVRHERLDALVDVANALRRGEHIGHAGRLVKYATPYPGTALNSRFEVHWVPQSEAPAVGYFPDPTWAHFPQQDAAIAVLAAGGLVPARFGVGLGYGAYMCESAGFMVSSREPRDVNAPGFVVSAAGDSAVEQQGRVPEVMRAAGWRVSDDQDWPDSWTVYPPEAG